MESQFPHGFRVGLPYDVKELGALGKVAETGLTVNKGSSFFRARGLPSVVALPSKGLSPKR